MEEMVRELKVLRVVGLVEEERWGILSLGQIVIFMRTLSSRSLFDQRNTLDRLSSDETEFEKSVDVEYCGFRV